MKSLEIYFLIFLVIYASIIVYTFTIRTLGADEGTHLLLGLFYRDLSRFMIRNGIFHAYDFGTNYLVYYPKLTITYPPLYHSIISLGFNFIVSEYVGKFITLMFSIGTIFLTYKIGEILFDKKVGLISALLLTFSPAIISLSGVVMIDIPIFFFFMLTLWVYLKAFKFKKTIYFILGGITLALGFLTKWNIIPIVPILIVYIVTKRKHLKREVFKKFILSLILSLVILLPYLVLVYKLDILKLMLTGPVSAGFREGDPQANTLAGWLWYPSVLFSQLTPQIALFCIIALVLIIKKKVDNWKLLLTWFLAFYIIFTVVPNKDGRFVISYLPVFIFSLSYFLMETPFKYKNIFLVFLILSEVSVAFYFLPRYYYPIDQIAETVYKNTKGNVALVSEDGIHSAAFMFHLAKLDRNRTIMVYRPCVFNNKTEGEIQQFLKERNIYYLVLVEDGDYYENFEKIKNVQLEKEFFYAKLYRYEMFDGKGTKKCNYICLTQEEICFKEL